MTTKTNNLSAALAALDVLVRDSQDALIHAASDVRKVGYLCNYTPVELLDAAGVLHARLFKGGDTARAAAGELYTQSVFCDFTKSCIGGFEQGDPLYKAFHKVYSFHTCATMKRAAETIELFTPTRLLNVPKLRSEPDSRRFFREEILTFRDDLAALTGKPPVTADALHVAIRERNALRVLLRQISELRRRALPLLSGGQFADIARAYYYVPPAKLRPALENIIAAAISSSQSHSLNSGQVPVRHERPIRLLAAGSIVADGDRRILEIVEQELGANVVIEDNCAGARPFHSTVRENGDPFAALADGYLDQAPCARQRPFGDAVDFSVRLAEHYAVEGVLYVFLKFCACYGIAQKHFIDRYNAAGLPVLALSSDYSESDRGQLLTRIEAFIEVLREKRLFAPPASEPDGVPPPPPAASDPLSPQTPFSMHDTRDTPLHSNTAATPSRLLLLAAAALLAFASAPDVLAHECCGFDTTGGAADLFDDLVNTGNTGDTTTVPAVPIYENRALTWFCHATNTDGTLGAWRITRDTAGIAHGDDGEIVPGPAHGDALVFDTHAAMPQTFDGVNLAAWPHLASLTVGGAGDLTFAAAGHHGHFTLTGIDAATLAAHSGHAQTAFQLATGAFTKRGTGAFFVHHGNLDFHHAHIEAGSVFLENARLSAPHTMLAADATLVLGASGVLETAAIENAGTVRFTANAAGTTGKIRYTATDGGVRTLGGTALFDVDAAFLAAHGDTLPLALFIENTAAAADTPRLVLGTAADPAATRIAFTDPVLTGAFNAAANTVAVSHDYARVADLRGFASLTALPLHAAATANAALHNHLDNWRASLLQNAAADGNNAAAAAANNAAVSAFTAYIHAIGATVDNGSRAAAPAFDATTFGGAVGADYVLAPAQPNAPARFLVGANLAYHNGRATIAGGGRTTQSQFRATAYASTLIANRYFADAALSGGISTYDTSRALPAVAGATNTARTDGYDLAAHLAAGAVFRPAQAFTATPYVALDFARADVNAFTEERRSAATPSDYALAVSTLSQNSLRAGLGTTFAWTPVRADTGLARVSLDIAYAVELLDDDTVVAARFVDPALAAAPRLRTRAAATAENTFRVSPAVEIALARNAALHLAYAYETDLRSQTAHHFNAAIRLRF
ncbi:MAG: 2-hydroxyacyl-CoA dehydratase [Puniceicoccales bacterium]|jgi:benzoyl-CoA reductase/2-hydroxyglutaryl-CoA dehydratase subunit BcrC/BadD/HgdB|nr:2-hydroxyacyl-CoA dehydratase [Puniceicoccales bacterium]